MGLMGWYGVIHQYAQKHYDMGWDFFVEGVGLSDFVSEMESQGFTTYEEAFDFYCQKTVDRLEAMEEARADCGWDDADADGDALASAGWGTDEDYGYFGGED